MMRKFVTIALFTTLSTAFSFSVNAKNYSLTLSNPDELATVKAEIMKGSITVQGYDGKTVEISANSAVEQKPKPDSELELEERITAQVEAQHRSETRKRSIEGLTKVTANSMQLDIVESNNRVTISSHGRKSVDVVVKVPFNSNLKLEVAKGGDIKVTGVTGSLELANHRGAIYASGVVGPIVAETHRRDIEVIFSKFNQESPSSLTSHRGSIDITVNADVKADIKVQTIRGEIYSGLAIPFEADNEVKTNNSNHGQHVTMGGLLSSKVNGGGQELTLTSYRGDIYVRNK